MQMKWSHAVLYVNDLDKMLNFYGEILGFAVTDRGPFGPVEGAEIVFLSQNPDEHHQLAMMSTRKEQGRSNSVDHFAFRVEDFGDVTNLHQQLNNMDGIKVHPISHGNTLSIYFNDPEGNGIEVFWDTPWHVAQPQAKPWDANLDREASLDWVKKTFGDEPSFEPREAFYIRRRD